MNPLIKDEFSGITRHFDAILKNRSMTLVSHVSLDSFGCDFNTQIPKGVNNGPLSVKNSKRELPQLYFRSGQLYVSHSYDSGFVFVNQPIAQKRLSALEQILSTTDWTSSLRWV